MPSYATPGVYIEEVAVFPPSVAGVATAVPAFVGPTLKAVGDDGEGVEKTAVRIGSLLEFEHHFGMPPLHDLTIDVVKRVDASDALLDVAVSWNATPPLPTQLLWYSLRLYFANGGGPCYVYSTGPAAPDQAAFVDAIKALEAEDEPTLLVFPDAVRLNDVQYGAVVDEALTSCNKMQDRFTIADVRDARKSGTDTNTKVTENFRARVTKNSVEFLKYGAAYFPYVMTTIPYHTSDANVTLTKFTQEKLGSNGVWQPTNVGDGKKLDDGTLDLAHEQTEVYAAIKRFLGQATVTLPPSGAIAGIYAQTDRTRGVWKAPANVGMAQVTGTAVAVTNDLQDGLNVDSTTGKSVNAVRTFFGKGTLVWGARTLAGNDGEWRYVNVRRFANFVEESVGKAIKPFVFEPNSPNTWVKVRTMIENFLTIQWRDGALLGAKAEDAFRVAVGLNRTMTPQDIIDGKMIVEVHLCIVRPAEFVVLRFMQQMPKS